MSTVNILFVPGDGIGPEVMGEVKKIVAHYNNQGKLSASVSEDLIGGIATDSYGTPLADSTIAKCRAADFVMLGAVGGPKWASVDYHLRPEAGLLKLRKELDLFANLRPAQAFDELLESSTLQPDIVRGLDIMIVRELTGGIYFGEPRLIEDIGNGERRGIDTQVYTSSEIRRISHVAFELAAKRRKKVCSVDKANVMKSGVLWREEISALHKAQYGTIELSHMYVDNCAMQLLRNPKQFDVIVTDNLFGDILSDEASMLTGSLGMIPSASLGPVNPATGKRPAVYEPVHGSAPDIAGQNKANPLASILSFAMALRYSLNHEDLATETEEAVKAVLAAGYRTPDIMAAGCQPITTSQMGDAVIAALQGRLEKAA
ncbi:MAG: 3-isopropylmalate dehydrogenase [Micavibrio aeruginosavorus]|uniref:3-isopropylmalate dehydrogenase n=1 Tax=Micavibrio aeruginosavorus TaxID=349221 RepID=A0A7T5R1C7_9BACT|nr:MAG: 3-isopropylmalate dehydrogenase [Micavibrio aeruginosavorus]